MGKRKTTKPPPPKKRAKLDKLFNCPFCNNARTVEVIMDKERGTGRASCGKCKQSFEGKANNLTEPIDIYHDWVDACENDNQLY